MANPWAWWTADRIAAVTGCPVEHVRENWPLIVDALDAQGIYDRDVARGVIGTVAIETASTFQPVREAYWLPESWRQSNLRYWPFYGRGFDQTTWENGYRDAGQFLGRDLLTNPDLLLRADLSAKVLAWRFATKGVPAKDRSRFWTFADLCRAHDWEWLRRGIQGGTDGLDRLKQIVNDLGGDAVALTYNPDQSPERQIQDWVCSIRAATWVLKSLGVNVDAGQMQDEMVPKYVTPDIGLLDGSGNGLAEVLRAHLPAGTRVEVIPAASWEDLVARAGRGPIALGLHGAYHWINVASVKGAQLDAPNPAPNYPREAPIGDQLTKDEFTRWGPASLVFVDAGSVPSAADPRDARIAQLEAEKAQLVTVIGYLTGDVARAIEAANNELKRHAPAA